MLVSIKKLCDVLVQGFCRIFRRCFDFGLWNIRLGLCIRSVLKFLIRFLYIIYILCVYFLSFLTSPRSSRLIHAFITIVFLLFRTPVSLFIINIIVFAYSNIISFISHLHMRVFFFFILILLNGSILPCVLLKWCSVFISLLMIMMIKKRLYILFLLLL